MKTRDIHIYKQFPILSETSYYAARAALAVQLGQPDKYQAFHDKLYAHQGSLADEAQVQAIAKSAGVDWAKVEAKIRMAASIRTWEPTAPWPRP